MSNHIKEIRQGGWSVFARKARKALGVVLYLIHASWVVPVLIAMRVLRPFILLRVGVFRYDRVGHFAADVGQRKAESLVNRSLKSIDFWCVPDNHLCSNTYWARVARRWFKVHPLVRYLYFWNRIVPFGRVHRMTSDGTHHSRDVNGFLEKANLSLPSTPSEEADAQRWMAQFGWQKGDPFVCLMVRDSAYLSKLFPESDTSYHDYRDSDVQTYAMAIEYLTDQGVFVFRMGKEMRSQVKYVNDKFVDYAFSTSRSDFLDVWLFANCNLCITTGSGPDMISDVFRRPLVVLNFLPFQNLWSWSNALHYPKILKWKDSGKTLSFTEYLDHTYFRTVDYEQAGIEIIDLDNYQIYEAVREGWQQLMGVRCPTGKELRLNKQFKLALKAHKKFLDHHKFLHPDARLASNFLKQFEYSFHVKTS